LLLLDREHHAHHLVEVAEIRPGPRGHATRLRAVPAPGTIGGSILNAQRSKGKLPALSCSNPDSAHFERCGILFDYLSGPEKPGQRRRDRYTGTEQHGRLGGIVERHNLTFRISGLG
jgi:hypothetical protein